MIELSQYADMYDELGVLNGFSEQTASGSFMIVGEDTDGLTVVARLLAARLVGVSTERAFDDFADIVVYPKALNREIDESVKSKSSSKKTKKADNAKVAPVNVDDVRDIVGSLYLTPFELKRRVFIINNADSMSDICQNKLLKSLEEPPSHVCFILCASGAMLPTVESRCITVEVPPFSVDRVRERLKQTHANVNVNTIELAATASRGNMGMAERIVNDSDFAGVYADALKILKLSTGSNAFATTANVYEKFTRERAMSVLGIIEYLLGDVAKLLCGVKTVFDGNDIRSVSTGYTQLSAVRSAEFARKARERLQANCMPQAVLDGFVLKVMEEKALCRK